jgi:hypothetical protein
LERAETRGYPLLKRAFQRSGPLTGSAKGVDP